MDSYLSAARNVELKARISSLDSARQIAQEAATARLRPMRQTDTYFRCPSGRLKLRRIERQPAQLIHYERADEARSRVSRYRIATVADPNALEAILAAAYGVDVVVEKRREVFLRHNVRIHLDDVSGLGTFIELEAVLTPDADESVGQAQVADLVERFGLARDQWEDSSYADLLRQMALH